MRQSFRSPLARVAIGGLLLAVVGASAGLAAQGEPAVGRWTTIDDQTGQAKSIVRIEEQAGVLHGTIEQVLVPGKQDAVCEACEGALKGRPIRGMRIIDGLVATDDGYANGTVLDPATGKVYKARMWVDPNGESLELRGYVGLPLFGRSQVWRRTR